jgi:glycerophosphoryl diester phosphodiesterase
MSTPLLLGHRGARAVKSIPENTLASFDLAMAHGCDGFEFDVRLTADGRAVICHDPEFQGIEIAKATSSQLGQLPTLDQVLARFANAAFLDIELKVAGLEEVTLHALQSHPAQRGYVISSFLPEVLEPLCALDSSVPLGLLCEDRAQLANWRDAPAQCVILHFTLVDDDLCAAVHSTGKKIFTWTVNASETMRRLQRAGVDGIISDQTRRLVETLRDKD